MYENNILRITYRERVMNFRKVGVKNKVGDDADGLIMDETSQSRSSFDCQRGIHGE